MDTSIALQYGWTLLVIIVLEGILSADNALVLAVLSKHLPEEQRKKAISIGLLFAFVFRLGAIFFISFFSESWVVQAIGALYLIYVCISHVLKKEEAEIEGAGASYGETIRKIAFADIAFAIDSILAAFALVIVLPVTPEMGEIGGMAAPQFIVIVLGAIAGLIVIKFASEAFVKLLHARPKLETAAMLIVGWVGVKLLMHALVHENFPLQNAAFTDFVHHYWNAIFWVVLIGIAVWGWFFSKEKTA